MATEQFYRYCRHLCCAVVIIATSLAGVCQEPEDSIVDVQLFAGPNRVYVNVGQLPNAVNYLPAPPDTTSALFVSDFQHWLWGKSIRGTARGTQASNESQYGLNRLAIIMGPVIGVSMSSSRTPKILNLIYQAGETGSISTQYAKMYYLRKRPFIQMGEHTWGRYDDEVDLSKPANSSYPSAHSAFGWAVGLVLAEMLPQYQDTILSRAYQYGQSRVIVGAHWQSDVDAARLTAAAAVARMHNEPTFMTDLAAARDEYYTLRNITPPDNSGVGWPQGKRFLETPVDSMSNYYLSDMMQYWQGRTERVEDSDRAELAVADADCSLNGLLTTFGNLLETTYSESSSPGMYDVIRVSREALVDAATQLQTSSKFRRRPYAQVGNQPLEGVDADAATSSYPSVNATIGWGIALLLAEIAPEMQEPILQRGYEMGRSAVIAGTEYASDVQAGRALACAVVARLHSRPEFSAMIARAKSERYDMPLITDVEELLDRSAADPEAWYSITGWRYMSRPVGNGIFIHNGRKVIQ